MTGLEESPFSRIWPFPVQAVGARIRPQANGLGALTACEVRIERAGIRVAGGVALTQYVLHVECAGGRASPRPSRITHTWVKQGAKWTLLGGMSHDQ